MRSLTTAGKLFVVSGAVLLSTMFSGFGVAAADTTSTIVPNTNVCYSGDSGSNTVTSTYQNDKNGKQTFTATWNNDNTFTITAATPMTKDVNLFVSDYYLTSPLYNGGCFSTNPAKGAFPQTWFDTESVTIAKGFVGSQTVSVKLPDTCQNLQVDLYYGKADSELGMIPLNSTIDQNGHSGYGFIAGNIMLTANNPACAPGKGGETPVVTPTTPTTPQVESASTVAPVALTDTGLNIWATSLIAAFTMASAIFVARKKPVTTN